MILRTRAVFAATTSANWRRPFSDFLRHPGAKVSKPSRCVAGSSDQFASAEHKQQFESSPVKYEPQFGGFCGYAASINRQHHDASTDASLRRLRFAVVFIFGVLLFLAGRAFAEANADAPTSKPDAVIDLATKEGVDLVKGQWRYSDTKIIQVDFNAAAWTNNQPANRLKHTISRRTRAAPTSTIQSGRQSNRQRSRRADRRVGFVLTGIELTSRSRRA